jgi:hypothetical protein
MSWQIQPSEEKTIPLGYQHADGEVRVTTKDGDLTDLDVTDYQINNLHLQQGSVWAKGWKQRVEAGKSATIRVKNNGQTVKDVDVPILAVRPPSA